MAVTREKKGVMLDELKDKFGKAKVAVFSQYKGLRVQDSSAVRKEFFIKGLEFRVAKKTLIRKALKELRMEEPQDNMLDGPIAVAFGYEEEIGPIKTLAKFAKEFEGLTMLGGYIEGKMVSKSTINDLAKIPGREELLAQFVGILQSPLSSFARMLNTPLGSFARGLKAYGEKKG